MSQLAGASGRPLITNRFATAPAGTGSRWMESSPEAPLGKRASRTGPVALMNELTAWSCAAVGASPTCGLPSGKPGVGTPRVLPGALPPTVGCEWHWKQLTALNEGPRPGKVEPPVCCSGPTTALTSNTASA